MSSLKLKRAKKEKAIEYLGGKCWRCEEVFDMELYDIHHIVPSTKKYEWSQLKSRTWDIIKKELDICVLLCSNCHRLAHKEMLKHANI
jgi:5-methylcytosine-specific restriction endonuclease McrA